MKVAGTAANRFYNSELFDKNVLQIIRDMAFYLTPTDMKICNFEVGFKKLREARIGDHFTECRFDVSVEYLDGMLEVSECNGLYSDVFIYSFSDGKEKGDFDVLLRCCVTRDVHDDYDTSNDPDYSDRLAICWHVVRKYHLESLRMPPRLKK